MSLAFWRRKNPSPDAAGSGPSRTASDNEDSGRTDPAAALRARARRRLIGAAALLLLVVVVVPMVLDPEPKPLADNIPIDIPSEKTKFSPRLALPPVPAYRKTHRWRRPPMRRRPPRQRRHQPRWPMLRQQRKRVNPGRHADKPMRIMADLIRRGRPAEEVMKVRGTEETGSKNGSMKLGRNDPCFCGSGLKFKKCHGK